MRELPPEEVDKFIEQVMQDLGDDAPSGNDDRILAACKDVDSENYLILMAVPATALSDRTGPEVWRTSDSRKFLAAFNEEELISKADEINEEYPDYTFEEKNAAMAEYLAGFMPALFERAKELPELSF